VFLGASSLSLDAKGRLSVPTRHHDALMTSSSGQVVITKHPHGCLMILPRPEWDIFSAKISALPMSSLWVKRIFLSNAMSVELDSTGRIHISPELREATGISRETTLRGMGNYFELWDKATYEMHEIREIKIMQEKMPDSLEGISF
jgi:MraZ protein